MPELQSVYIGFTESKMNILITGAAGFIGSALVEYHLNKQDTVYGLDNLSTGNRKNLKEFLVNKNFKFINAELNTYPALINIVHKVDRVYHLAAVVGMFRVMRDPEKVLTTNLGIAERILQLAQTSPKRPQVVIVSTSEVYGVTHENPLKEDSSLIISDISCDRSAYAISKIASESYALAYYHMYKLPTIILRLFNTIGPRQTGKYGMVVPRFVNSAVLQEPLTVYGSGEQKRCFIDVRDTVSIMDEIASSEKCVGEIFNIGSNCETSINQLAELVKKIASSSSEINHISYQEAYGEDLQDYQERIPDISKLKEYTNYHNQWTLEKTIQDLVLSAKKSTDS